VNLRVTPVTTARERRIFYRLPERLYGDDPAFIPMLDKAFKDLVHRKRNPFWKQAVGREWLCHRGDEVVGRIAACKDESQLARTPGMGSIGFFESVQDTEVAATLFKTAEAWLREAGCTHARGPLNYSIHDTAALLVDGFETPPVVDTTWNPAYYGGLWDGYGWKGVQDMLALAGPLEYMGPKRAKRFAERVKRRGIDIRPIDESRFDEEVEAARQVYNGAWDANWGHIPIGRELFLHKAREFKTIYDPDIVRLAEADGKIVGLLMALPDLNPAIRRSRGRLLPFGWWRLIRSKRTTRRLRTVVLGVIPGYRKRGIEAALLIGAYEAHAGRYTWHEASWVLADNDAILNELPLYKVEPYKRWRMYEKALD
jgi:GNAT superfamily N-acetyltransferase